MKVLSHGCTLDCFDCCKFNVYVEDGQVCKIEGDPNHPYTKGFICLKGRKHLERLKHKERIYSPLKKVNGRWVEIDFEEAIELISQKLLYYRDTYGSDSVMHFTQSGTGGVSKQIEDVFFNFYGGVTLPKGSLCWGAGIQAQRYDFGDARGHFLEDMFNAENIILWGRNPFNTSLHLAQMVKKAKNSGVKIIVIDPLFTDTAKLADIYIRPNPSTDGALAMALAKIIIEHKMVDQTFINEHVLGFNEYRAYLDGLDLNWLVNETGVDIETVKDLARLYGSGKPSTIYVGYGLQKYQNGGTTIRAIDALGAITGNIGQPGSGVNYANKVYPDILNKDPYKSSAKAVNNRFFNVADFAGFVKKAANPPVKAIFVSKANPLAQMPNLKKTVAAFEGIEFKVCFDMFMTDTARYCDLFIPCTNTLETEDLIYSSMCNPYITFNERAVEPSNIMMDEYYFFQQLAVKMGMTDYPIVDKTQYLAEVIKPLREKGIDLEKIKAGYVTIQEESLAWRDMNFKTPSGKIEIYSQQAQKDGLSPIPVYFNNRPKGKLRLISSHPKNSIFSQHYLDTTGIAKAFINREVAEKYNISEGEEVTLKSENGEIKVQIMFSDNVPKTIVHMYTGWWEKHGNPNQLTSDGVSEMGGLVAYYDTFIEIVKNY